MGRQKGKAEEHAGNALDSRAAYAKQMLRLGELVNTMEASIDNLWDDQIQVTSIRLSLSNETRSDVLVVIKATTEGEAILAFHSAETIPEAVTGLCNRLKNKSLKWKEDEYANQNNGKG